MFGTPTRRNDRTISCRDLAGRRHHIIVLVDDGRVVLITPPAETAVLEPQEVGALRHALREAILQAARQQPQG